MNILITGATGFVGNTLVEYLVSNSTHKVAVVTRRKATNFPTGVDILEIDSIDENVCWGKYLDDVQCIIHMAARAHVVNDSAIDPLSEFRQINVDGTINLAHQAAKAGIKRFIFISSIGVNGSLTLSEPFSDKSPTNPHSPYSVSKLEAENALWDISKETDMEIVVIRPPLVYGPNAPGNFGSLTNLVQKLPFLPFGLTDNKRDFISVKNLADLLMVCANHPNAAGHTFLASDGETVSIKAFTNAIAKGLNKSLIQLPVPTSLMRLAASLIGKSAMAEQLLGNLQVDSSNAQDVLDWTPPYTMEQAMASLSESKK